MDPNIFYKIVKNKSEVFVDSNDITDSQMKQINGKLMVQLNRVVVPEIKLKNMCPSKNRKPLKDTKCDSKLTINYIKDSNDSNVALNCLTNRPKRKLRSDALKNKCQTNDKKLKSTFNTIDDKSVGLNICDKTPKKNKENQNNCNTEMSRIIGLPNMGNTCYINSIIQVLRMTPGFRQFICSLNNAIISDKNDLKLQKSNKQLISSLHSIFVHFGQNEANYEKTSLSANESKISDLIECDDLKNRFEFGQQHDCHEFLNWLINELNSFAELLFPKKSNSSNTSHKRKKNSLTFQGFKGVMVMNIMCSECQKGSSIHDSFADIQIPLCINEEMSDSLQTQTFTEIIHKKYYLKDDDMFDCSNCSKKTNASVVNSIETPPKTLIICIKKPFEYNQMNTRNVKTKKKLFNVPITLDYSIESSNKSSKLIHYCLYGFIMHNGSDIDNGHYFAVIDSEVIPNKSKKRIVCSCAPNVLSNNGWIKVNDHRVQKITTVHLNKFLDNDNISSSPYLAFYQRID